jgi:hypothetical protein
MSKNNSPNGAMQGQRNALQSLRKRRIEMKRLLFLVLIFALAACGPVPTAAPPAATQPPVVITVVVPATDAPAPAATEVPPTAVPPTAAPAATDVPAATATVAPVLPTETPVPGAAATATMPPAVGGDQLVNITRSGDNFSLKCSPSQIIFTATSINTGITDVQIWYRMVDKVTGMSSSWYSGGSMDKAGKTDFTRTFSALDISTDVRARENGWFEYQFVALNKVGNVIWRSPKGTYEKQVTYTKECP